MVCFWYQSTYHFKYKNRTELSYSKGNHSDLTNGEKIVMNVLIWGFSIFTQWDKKETDDAFRHKVRKKTNITIFYTEMMEKNYFRPFFPWVKRMKKVLNNRYESIFPSTGIPRLTRFSIARICITRFFELVQKNLHNTIL